MFGFRMPALATDSEEADTPGFKVGQTDEVPGFRVKPADDFPGFRMPVRGPAQDAEASGLHYLLYSPASGPQVTPVDCISAGGKFGCTTPKGVTFSDIPAPSGFPARIAPDIESYHGYEVQSPPGTSAQRLMQGVVERPTPGPPYLNHPATSEGALNEATPSLIYNGLLAGSQLPYGSPMNPVKSYLSKDSNGNPIVVNVTEPGHGLEPGYVVHYIVDTPEGPRIQTEGEGLSPYQGPNSPEWVRRFLSSGTWEPYQQKILDQSR